MIYCNLKGGMANIMFQIAACKKLAIRKNTSCCFPNFLAHLEYTNSRWQIQYNTSNLGKNFKNNALEYKEFINIDHNAEHTGYPIKLYRYPFHYIDFIPNEDTFAVDGYFQSEKYFSDIREDILKTFCLTKEAEALMIKKYQNVLKNKSVSLHVRRADYLRYPGIHPVLPISYYKKALDLIGEYDNCLLFSDDIEWCKNNMKFKNMVFVEQEKDYIEMFLMSKCQNNIIANSSFSWWGAWLNKKEDKQVIAPSQWFGTNINEKTEDLIPDDWRII